MRREIPPAVVPSNKNMFDKIKPILITLGLVLLGMAIVHRVAPLKKVITGAA